MSKQSKFYHLIAHSINTIATKVIMFPAVRHLCQGLHGLT